MEAVPRLPMLSFETKPYFPKNAQFGSDLMNLIRQHYQEDPNNYNEEIQQLEKLRQQATKLNKDIDGIAILKRYFCQLYFLQKRFPMLKDLSVSSEISWKDLLSSSNSRKIDYRLEFTTTLYNIGILHTQLGAADDRTTAEGLKLACTHFQCAAWAFQYLREVTSINVRPDFDHGFLEFLISTCLAQAQECIAEKSITDNRKPSISAKVVTQICEYYETAKHALSRLIQEDSILIDYGIKHPQVCMNYLRYKQPYYKCVTNLFLGMQAEEEEKMGERVAYFELASEELKEALRYARDAPLNKGLDEALNFTHDVVEGKRKNAVNENEFIYHEEVPPKDNLQKVKGAPLVKCIGFDFNDPDISGPDIFSKLISMKVHQLSSVYSEEKAKLLRNVSSSVEEKESELNSFMQSFKLDYLNLTEDPNVLPEELIERCAACEAKPMIANDLISSMNKLADVHSEVDCMMKEITELIEEENKAEEEYQSIMNTTRPPSIVATDLKCEANRYNEALKKAADSNNSLRNAISAHVNNLRILSMPLNELEKQLPTVSFNYSPEEKNIVKELQRLVDKVEEMKNQRALLMLQLRESLRNDDITEQIALSDDDKSDFSATVDKEIAKHQNIVILIDQNLKAQTNILKAITNVYASYAPIRKEISETAHKRGVQINTLIESFDVSDDVLKKTVKGLEFYRKLQINVRKLLNRVKGTCKVQEEERLQMYSKEGKKFPTTNQKNSINSVTTAERILPSSTPKLKDYIGQKPFIKTINDVPLPYNPYYNAPKLKDYIGQKPFSKIINDVPPLPYNPYYNALSSYVPTITHNLEENHIYPTATSNVSVNQYYASVTRPPPVGSETTVMPVATKEPSSEVKNTIPSTAFVPNSLTYYYSNFNATSPAYYSTPSSNFTENVQSAYPNSYLVRSNPSSSEKQHNHPSSSEKQHNHPSSSEKQHNHPSSSEKQHNHPPSSEKQHNPSSSEKQQESNLDLLADLDFDISDTPLLPISEAVATNKIIEKLTNLNLTAVSEKKDSSSSLEEKSKMIPPSDPFSNDEYFSRFIQDAEKFEKFVEKLTVVTLNGSIPLDVLWNEYTTQQEKFLEIKNGNEDQKCKNRISSAIPYDNSKVILTSSDSGYINASKIKNLNPSVPDLIVTQLPLQSTISDFWSMIWDEEIELIVCLLTENEITKNVYFPKEKNEKLEVGYWTITLHSINSQVQRIERIFSISKDKITRIVTHIQLVSWVEELFSQISNPLLDLLNECISFYFTQRDLNHCIVVHCDTGVGRSGLFVALIAFVGEINSGKGIPDLMALLKLMSESYKNLIKNKEHLLLISQLGLCFIQSILVKYGKRSYPEVSQKNSKTESACNTENVFSYETVNQKYEQKYPDRLLSKEENKKRNTEQFGIEGNLECSTNSTIKECDDPFNSIDPLWLLKKQ